VLAHVPELNDFVAGLAIVLKPQGTVTIEFPHVLKLIEHVEFDTIYHEHFSYLSVLAIDQVFRRHRLRLYDVQELPTHGGSLRIYACHTDNSRLRETDGLRRVVAQESAGGLDKLETYSNFAARVQDCRASLLDFLNTEKSRGKCVVGYGAAAKGNTLLNYCGVTTDLLPVVADRNPHKQGKLLPGTHIPIVTPEDLLAARPDYILILPWNIKEEVMRQLQEVRTWGARFVTAIPVVRLN
jgi:C-methyltransferase C-terminal domain